MRSPGRAGRDSVYSASPSTIAPRRGTLVPSASRSPPRWTLSRTATDSTRSVDAIADAGTEIAGPSDWATLAEGPAPGIARAASLSAGAPAGVGLLVAPAEVA